MIIPSVSRTITKEEFERNMQKMNEVAELVRHNVKVKRKSEDEEFVSRVFANRRDLDE